MSEKQIKEHRARNAVLEATWLALRTGCKVCMLKVHQGKPWARVYLG